MSLSVGGYHGAYAHPGASMGLATPHDYYGAAAAPGQYFTHGYPDYTPTERDFYNNWVLNGAPDVPISPEPYGTPSPPGMAVGTAGYPDGMQSVPQWQNYPMTTEELAIAHNIPLSELGQYEAYTNRFGDRCIRRRTSANKKERRRTLSINNAFSNLRGSIPNVPSDTKLSKIKTLRLAISYISYLSNILEKGETDLTQDDFKADISRKRERRSAPVVTSEKKPGDSCESDDSSESCSASSTSVNEGRMRGRTGWPQEVWASELTSSPTQIKILPLQANSPPSTGSPH